jgi:hypothetical protein
VSRNLFRCCAGYGLHTETCDAVWWFKQLDGATDMIVRRPEGDQHYSPQVLASVINKLARRDP